MGLCSLGKRRRRRLKWRSWSGEWKIASEKALSIILRCGVLKAALDRRETGKVSCRLLPRTSSGPYTSTARVSTSRHVLLCFPFKSHCYLHC
jgi:hypothetical protein